MIHTARRHYLRAYRRWLEADAAWQRALCEAQRLVPDARARHAWPIGHGGSRVRRAYEARARAIEALHMARRVYVLAERTAQHRRSRTVLLLRLPDRESNPVSC